jgi:hypothetical protein
MLVVPLCGVHLFIDVVYNKNGWGGICQLIFLQIAAVGIEWLMVLFDEEIKVFK